MLQSVKNAKFRLQLIDFFIFSDKLSFKIFFDWIFGRTELFTVQINFIHLTPVNSGFKHW